MVTYFSAAEKDRGMKFCMRVRLLSGQVFSHFGELWLVASHGRGITSRMYVSDTLEPRNDTQRRSVGSLNWVPWVCGAVASSKAVWWDLCLASLLTHLF